MGSSASLEVREPGPDADGLLQCLRERVADYDVGIAIGDHGGGLFIVTDLTGSVVGDLQSFLAIRLDACGREAGVDWGRYLTLAQGE